jgi:asparagine synthase (glutamine-hydrolysing)
LPGLTHAVDAAALDAYFTLLYIPEPRTIFKAVKKLPAGCVLYFRQGHVRLRRYWQVPLPQGILSKPALAKQMQDVRQQLEAAVRLRLVSDVPLGAFLSGGVDSSTVVGLMARALQQPVRTFSIGFEQPFSSYNELPAARMAAQAFHTEHREYRVAPDVVQLLPKVVWHLDEPLADSSALITYLICREARANVTVALTGIGGDELFGGYPRYLGAWLALYYERLPAGLRELFSGWVRALPETATSTNLPGRFKRFVRSGPLSRNNRYLGWITYLDPMLKEELYTDTFMQAVDGADPYQAHRQVLQASTADHLSQLSALDLQTYLPGDLLMLGDKLSMAHGLEVRVPFCDHMLIEAAARIPLSQRMQGLRLKGLLRTCIRDVVPHALLRRRKQGFMVPLSAWLRRDLAGLCRELLSPERVRQRGWLRPAAVTRLVQDHQRGQTHLAHTVYSFLVFEVWCQQVLDAPAEGYGT